MAELSIKADIKDVTRFLNNLDRKQIPFATAAALTRTAQDVKKELDKQLPAKLDRPTRFTKNAIGYTGAKKSDLKATVFIKDIQWKYLKYQIQGGTRVTRGKGTGVPTRNKKLNAFGNIPGRKGGIVKGKKQYIATIKGISGVWEKTGGKKQKGVRLLIAFEKEVNYKPIFPFIKIAEGITRSKFIPNFNRALQRAIDTAR